MPSALPNTNGNNNRHVDKHHTAAGGIRTAEVGGQTARARGQALNTNLRYISTVQIYYRPTYPIKLF